MSSERFEYAEDELESVLERLASGLSQLEGSQGEARKRVKQICEKSLEDGDKLIEEMDLEARSAPLQYRAQMIASVRALQSRLTVLRNSYRSINSGSAARHSSGGGGARGSGSSRRQQLAGDGVREKVISGIRTLERTGDSLYRSQQVAVETEQVGTGIIEDLGTQRESLERTRNRLVDTESELNETRSVLRKMYRNVIASKITLICIIFIEIGILIAVVYWKYFRK
eukprot:TRINITY_DN35440_c0_g1_i1.p1 TRINITY_DN35440_c0_g1~~TRINITY_DN35440_c0_g1_i1.p1  ORF type:complete len:227 (+),score=47.04 TRINITY_DN35440_c0_g1_i1:104-784(+)